METLKSLRAKAKELRSKVSGAPISKASADQLKAEIAFFERAAKADVAREQRMANLNKARESKMAPVEEPEKKKSKPKAVKKVEMGDDMILIPVPKTPKAKPTKREMDSSDE
jgi:hypothetical protein